MTRIVFELRNAARKRANYHRTLVELRRMPHETMIDLDIAPNEFRQRAYQAVYGD